MSDKDFNTTEALVLQTQTLERGIRDDLLNKLIGEMPPRFSVHLLLDADTCGLRREELPPNVPVCWFRHDRMVRFKRAGRYPDVFPGNLDAAHLQFWKSCPHYDYYWFIEYDVRFTGNWNALFEHFRDSESDLLATSIARRSEIPDWNLWQSLEPPESIPEKDQIRAFLPFYRISRRACAILEEEYQRGWAGHNECTLPTALHLRGLEIEDIGGDGEFVRQGNVNRFYRSNLYNNDLTPGTFVFRPHFNEPGEEQDTLWHPVKSAETRPWETNKPNDLAKRIKRAYWVVHRGLRRSR